MPDKAIKFDMVTVKDHQGQAIEIKQLYVRKDLCIGCGICGHVCPLPGQAAVQVVGSGLADWQN